MFAYKKQRINTTLLQNSEYYNPGFQIERTIRDKTEDL